MIELKINASMNLKSIVIPHEHGGWAMVSVPFLVGVAASSPQWLHVPLFIAWLGLYLTAYPLLQSLKRNANRRRLYTWAAIYGTVALVCLIPAVVGQSSLLWFGPVLVGLLLVNIWHVRHKAERSLTNDLCAMLVFSLGGAAAYLIGSGEWDYGMLIVVLFSFLHFTGSTFFVKSVFRERNNPRWIRLSRLVHVILLFIPAIVGYPWMGLAFVYSAARAFRYAGQTLRPMKVGFIEIIGAVQFLLWFILL
ncbi:YwiC-like family protein [Paenibacillus sp. RRE4]|uniref:YwiC-like family protein n=1 Tax=Paenibacillus sp. RRE4 TaxID=2962587 RepID=UPI00288B2834|nr:YwiC-like family protein [Paenibacillus sp. RRE4]